jgi:hypothetical protein
MPATSDDHLVELDRRLRKIQLELAPDRDPAPVREPRVADETPLQQPLPPPDSHALVTSKLIASMRELLDALESATIVSDRRANH